MGNYPKISEFSQKRKYTETSILPHEALRQNKWIFHKRKYTMTSALPHEELPKNKWIFPEAEMHYDQCITARGITPK